MSQFDLTKIIKILDFESSKELNRHLDVGWILIGTRSNQYSQNGFSLSYSAGWSKESGEIAYPEKTAQEIEMENWPKNPSPFD